MSNESQVKEAMVEYWGERCEEHDPDCPACRAWDEYDRLKEAIKIFWEKEGDSDGTT